MLNNSWKNIIAKGDKLEEYTSISDFGQYKIQVALEVLEGCSYNCPGCFVKRKGNWDPESIQKFYDLAYQLKDRKDIILDDLVIGPTDFFGAQNLGDIVNNKMLAEAISFMHDGCRNIQHNCSIMGSLSEEDIASKIQMIENSHLAEVVESWDVQIALDTRRLLTDKDYLRACDERVETFRKSKLDYEISIATNITDGIEDTIYDAIDFVRDRYLTVIEVLPSVVRSFHRGSAHSDKLFRWNAMLDKLAEDPVRFKTKFHFLQGDISHKAYQYSIVNIHGGNYYMAPFIYENAQIYNKDFNIELSDDIVDSILKYKHNVVQSQIDESGNKECGSCKYLNVCSHRLIPKVMDVSFDSRKECILNKNVISLYDDEVYRGNS